MKFKSKLIISTGMLLSVLGCSSKYDNVKACYAKNQNAVQTCCQQNGVSEAECNEFMPRIAHDLAQQLMGK